MSFQRTDGKQIRESLCRVLVATVSGIDNGDCGSHGCDQGAPSFGMAHGADICVAGRHADRIRNALAFAAELESAVENPRTLPPRFIIAASKLKRVRVLGS